MHINVRDLQVETVGYSRTYKISGERPELETIKLTEDVNGEVTLSRLETAILVTGHVTTAVELTCDRCLCTFNRPLSVSFRQLYADEPKDDEMPIVDHEIDLAPLIEQEIILDLPIKTLHSPDCPGLPGAEQAKPDQPRNLIKDNARITKGTKRGRT